MSSVSHKAEVITTGTKLVLMPPPLRIHDLLFPISCKDGMQFWVLFFVCDNLDPLCFPKVMCERLGKGDVNFRWRKWDSWGMLWRRDWDPGPFLSLLVLQPPRRWCPFSVLYFCDDAVPCHRSTDWDSETKSQNKPLFLQYILQEISFHSGEQVPWCNCYFSLLWYSV